MNLEKGKASITVYPDGTTKGFFFEIDEELHTSFKSKAAEEKKNMKEILIDLIEKYVG